MSDSDNSRLTFNPRHRVVGAIVLVVLAILFVPLILNEKQLTTQDTGNGIILSDKDTRVFVSRAEDIRRAQSKGKNISSANSYSGPVASNNPRINKTTSRIPPKVEKTEPKKISTPLAKERPVNKPGTTTVRNKSPDKKKNVSSNITRGWVVQIGTYSDPANARKVRASLVRRGYHVRLEKIRLPEGNATRVRVGPFSDRGKAITTLSHIGRDVGLQGVILRYP